MARVPNFGAAIGAWAKMCERRMLAVVQESAQDLTEEVQMSRFKGGRMPVDTGFLTNSFTASINSVPSGQGIPAGQFNSQEWDNSAVVLTISRVKLGDRLVMGFTANYAQAMEARYAFTRSAVQNWEQIVRKAAIRVERTVNR